MHSARKHYLATLFLRLLMEKRPPFYVVPEPREGLAAYSAKGVPSFLSYFKTLSIVIKDVNIVHRGVR